MCGSKKLTMICFCGVMLTEFCSGNFGPYPGAFYPPPSYNMAAMPPYPFYPPFFGAPPLYGGFPPAPRTNHEECAAKPKPAMKPMRISSSSAPVILPNRGDLNAPIIISTKSRRQSQPTLLTPLANLIHSVLKSFSPKSCDCDDKR